MHDYIAFNLQCVCANLHGIPKKNKIKLWVKTIFSTYKKKMELTIRVVDIQEMLHLNWYYSGKNYPTNVLSFPFESPYKIQPLLLGDIIICKKIIEYEAQQNNISSEMHWAYIITHGSLHLLGYNHLIKKEALLMHQMELNIMKKIGFKI